MTANTEEDFWSRVDKSGECWLWTGAPTTDGYGKFYMENRTYRAHKLAWKFCGNKIPKGRVLRHKCRNRLCVDPAHLRLGTQKQNVHDAIKDGTHISVRHRLNKES